MTLSLKTLAAALLALALGWGAAAPALLASDDTKWLRERNEERRKKAWEEKREREKRDPLVPLYVPGGSGSSSSGFSAQNPVAPRTQPKPSTGSVK